MPSSSPSSYSSADVLTMYACMYVSLKTTCFYFPSFRLENVENIFSFFFLFPVLLENMWRRRKEEEEEEKEEEEAIYRINERYSSSSSSAKFTQSSFSFLSFLHSFFLSSAFLSFFFSFFPSICFSFLVAMPVRQKS